MFIRYFLGSLAFLCLCQLSAQQFSTAAVDSLFAEWDSPNQPGAAIGIFQGGKIIYQQGYGSANLEHRIPITSTTVFRIGSVSKQFTAACFLLLVQEGKVTLETKLTHFYPDFPAYGKDITMAHLLYHTSGLRDYDQLVQYSPSCDFDCFYDEDLFSLLYRQQALNSPPGTQFQYTNSGYWLLGQIIEKISGQTLAEFAQNHLFAPLAMPQSHFTVDYTSVVANKAYGYEEDPESAAGYYWYNTTNSIVGDGGLMTSIADFKRWDDAFYQREVLTDAFWKVASTRGQLINGDTLTYA
ncbi:MAG: serine hydrolase domain-containing protein, partial [Bacteroidota bacterium]